MPVNGGSLGTASEAAGRIGSTVRICDVPADIDLYQGAPRACGTAPRRRGRQGDRAKGGNVVELGNRARGSVNRKLFDPLV